MARDSLPLWLDGQVAARMRCVMEWRRPGAQWVYCAVSKAVIFFNPQCTACARIASRLPLK